MKALHLIIHGRVQGVGYREWLMNTARLHKLHGWVRNLTNGTVEAVLAGAEASVMACISACHEGPPAANVCEIELQPYKSEVLPSFERKQTAESTRQAPRNCL